MAKAVDGANQGGVPTLSFAAAMERKVPFKKHKGETIREVLRDDPLYLDWLIRQSWLFADLREALNVVLSDPVISRQMERAMAERPRWQGR